MLLAQALGVAALLLASCRSAETAGPPSPDAVVAAFSGSRSSAGGGGSGSGAAGGATRRSSGGSVTIDVKWENPQETRSAPTFSVVMDTHSVDLDGYDLAKLAVLRNDRGQEVKPRQWDAPPGGHHRSGILAFPAEDGSGRPMVEAGTKVLELVIRDVSGVKERVLRWEVS